MASALTPMIRTDEEKRKHPLPKMIGVIPDFVHCPYHIAFDTIFYQHFLANKDSVVAEVEDLIGGSFELHYTPCVMSRITKNRFRTDLAFKYVNFEEVRCYDDVGYVANDFNCLSKVMQEEKDLILATGNNRLRVLCRKITHAPIIFLEDGALFFEGLHRGRNVVTEIEDPIGNTFLGKKILEKVGIRREAATPSKLYVGNLEWEVDDEWLKRVFSKYGEVIEARVICDRETGRSRGFGFVTMASKAEMNKAIARLDGKDLYGRKIWVNVANERPNNGSSSKKVKTERERKPVKDTLVSAAKNGKAVEGSSSSKQAAGWASSTGHVTEYESRAVLMHKGPITSHDPFAKFKSRLSTKEIEDEASRGTLSSTKTSKRKRKGSDYAESASCAAVASKKVKTDNETKSVKVKLASAAKNGAGVKGASSSKPATTSVSSAGPLTEDEIADKFQSRLHTKEVPDASSRIIHGGFVRSGFGGSNCNSGGRTGGHGFFGSGVGRSSGYGGSGGGFGSSSSSYGGDRKYGGRFSFGGGRSSGYGGTGGRFGSGGGRSSGDGGTGGRFGYRSL